MPKGGKREGAGSKPRSDSPAKQRQIRFTDSEWDQVKLKAINDKSISDYIRRKALE